MGFGKDNQMVLGYWSSLLECNHVIILMQDYKIGAVTLNNLVILRVNAVIHCEFYIGSFVLILIVQLLWLPFPDREERSLLAELSENDLLISEHGIKLLRESSSQRNGLDLNLQDQLLICLSTNLSKIAGHPEILLQEHF